MTKLVSRFRLHSGQFFDLTLSSFAPGLRAWVENEEGLRITEVRASNITPEGWGARFRPRCDGATFYLALQTDESFDGSETIPLRIIQHDSPSNPMFRCPLLTTCDAPVFTKLCVGDDATPCG